MNFTRFFNCSIRNTVLLTAYFFLSNIVTAQYCTNDNRFTEEEYFSDSELDSAKFVVYATVTNWNNETEDLQFNVFFPKNATDPLPMRPFVLLIHGGGFTSGSKIDLNDECRAFAKRGFVAATIDYRLGHTGYCDSTYDNAVYRALQDANAAFEYVVNNSGLLKIDTSWMFVGGGSAGAGTSLGLVYLSQSEWNAQHPYIQPLLGNLKSPGFDYSIKGIFNNWGATLSTAIEEDEMIPTISFHGDADSVANIDSSASCSSIPGGIEYGSRTIHTLLTEAGICSELNIKIGGGHGVYIDPSSFRVSRAVCFFKSIFCDNCSSFSTTDSIPAVCSQETGITFLSEKNSVKAFPNPTSGWLMIPLSNTIPSSVSVYTIMGNKAEAGVRLTETAVEIDLSERMPGIYVVELVINGERQQIRIVKQ